MTHRRDDRGKGRGVDYATGMLSLHHRDHRLAHEKRAGDVDSETGSPPLLGHRVESAGTDHAGIVDENVNAAVAADNVCDDFFDPCQISNVTDVLSCGRAGAFQLL